MVCYEEFDPFVGAFVVGASGAIIAQFLLDGFQFGEILTDCELVLQSLHQF